MSFVVTSDVSADQMAAALKAKGKLALYGIHFATDATGNPDHNLDLSRRRAESVKTYLAETFGIEADRLSTRGLGAGVPVGDNSTESGRALNRRVELVRQE